MSNKINFRFDSELEHQIKAINSTVDLFEGLPKQNNSIYNYNKSEHSLINPSRNKDIKLGEKLLNNLKKVQLKNELYPSEEIFDKNFTIEMETGTGKTYVYLRTILELYKKYDFKKFLIVVPSIPIRKGIEKSIEQLGEHFQRLYNIDLKKYCFIYDSGNTTNVRNFIGTTGLRIMITNIQSFNKSVNKIQNEDEYGTVLWDEISHLKTIVIIDEPQKIEGQKNKKSESLKAIEKLEPLFTLRYSATHKNLYNQIYKLDSYDAYKKELVKKIRVKTVNGIISKDFPYIRYTHFTSNAEARIEMFTQKQGDSVRIKTFNVSGNESLEELSGGLSQYKNMFIAEAPHKEKPIRISTNGEDIYLNLGDSNSNISEKDIAKIQIRLAIENHFEKQFEIIENKNLKDKIKALTLFFVDSVEKVRSESEDGRGEYLKIFDEEYENYINRNKEKFEKYKQYFPNYENTKLVREGYFAKDKKGKDVEINYDIDNLNKKTPEEITRGISLILEKKDELISFEEPLAFIFSHSALREGWDNPNVFTLCTLKHGSSEIAKKQEIGRGLRLPVDVKGNRCLDSEINELTIIANDSYDNFSRALQEDLNKDFNKNEVSVDILKNTLEKAGIPMEKISQELINDFKNELINKEITDEKNILKKDVEKITEIFENIEFQNEILKEHTTKIKEEFVKLMQEKGSRRIEIKNGDNEPIVNKMRNFVSEAEFKEIYNRLSETLKKRTFYKCNIDKEEFIQKCVDTINETFKNYKFNQSYLSSTFKGVYDETKRMKTEIEIAEHEEEYNIQTSKTEKSDFEIIDTIMNNTMLPRLAVYRILKKLSEKSRKALNEQENLDEVTKEIKRELDNKKAESIKKYEIIEGYELEESKIFEIDNISEDDIFDDIDKWKIFQSNTKKKRALNEYYKMDSKGEKEFAKCLEDDENTVLFTKLKKGGFIIDTPYGNYSPDWAIVYKSKNEYNKMNLYFIVETKAGKNEENLTDVEKNKIKCGKKHFEVVSDTVKFGWVNSYEKFRKELVK